MRREPRTITKDEARALLAQPNPACPTGLRNRAMMEIMYRAGLRVSEVTNLRPGDIRWQAGRVEVRDGKGGVDRTVPLDPETMNWLRQWDEERPKGGHFFTTLKGTQVLPRYVRQMIDRAAEKAGLNPADVSPHVLRHSYATELLDEGYSIREVQTLLGHSSVRTTQRYTHVDREALAEKIAGRGQEDEGPERTEAEDLAAQVLAALPQEVREALARMASEGNDST
ncbi:MAG: tyrosine-type recombinase/integrase [Armatimonadota bacterium]|nr:tyrosine-type recombinase/integrase [Armatimonadota bacterium]